MPFDPNYYYDPVRAFGRPQDDIVTNPETVATLMSYIKGLLSTFTGAGGLIPPADTIAATRHNVTTVAAQVFAADADRVDVTVKNLGTQTAYLGALGVTNSTGYPLEEGESLSLGRFGGALYAVTSTSTAELSVVTLTG